MLTHDAPASAKLYLGYDGVDELNRYFETLRDEKTYVARYSDFFICPLSERRFIVASIVLLW